MNDQALESLVQEIGFGIVLGVAALIVLIILIARSDRRPPDKKDGP